MNEVVLDKKIYAGLFYLLSGNLENVYTNNSISSDFYSNLRDECLSDNDLSFIPNSFIVNIANLNIKALINNIPEDEYCEDRNKLFCRFLFEDEWMSFSIKLDDSKKTILLNDGVIVDDIHLILEKQDKTKVIEDKNYLINIFKLNELKYIDKNFVIDSGSKKCIPKLFTRNYSMNSTYAEYMPKLNLNRV